MTHSAEIRASAFRMAGLLARPLAGGPGAASAAPRRRPWLRPALLLGAAALGLPGCQTLSSLNPFASSGPPAGTPGFVRGFLGGVAADDPAGALAAREVLSAGGTAVDAAVAAGFVMAVTLPSRVGIGGGGACLVFDPAKGAVEAVTFLPGARDTIAPGSDRPAAVPMLARGLFALHTRRSTRPFESLMAPAEQAARFGTEVGRGLAADLAAVSGPLFADPGVKAVFAQPNGAPKAAGDRLVQPDLAGTLGQIRVSGVGDLHQGVLARRLEEVSVKAGGGLTIDDLRAGLPRLVPPLTQPTRGGDQIAFLPPPADGGLAAAASFAALEAGQSPAEAQSRGLAVASAWRAQGGDPRPLLAAANLPPAGPMMSVLPASAGLVVFDRQGVAVSCTFTLNNLFGTGRMAPGMGFLLAAAPNTGSVRGPLLAAAIAYNPNIRAFRAAAAGTGQAAAPMAVAGPSYMHLMRRDEPGTAVERGVVPPGRVEFAACPRYLPGRPELCTAISDPRGTGVAVGSID
jgi:gamma-glutamyltranspeptidase/glutathione hydrolase